MVSLTATAFRVGRSVSQWADATRIAFGRGSSAPRRSRKARAGVSCNGRVGAPCETKIGAKVGREGMSVMASVEMILSSAVRNGLARRCTAAGSDRILPAAMPFRRPGEALGEEIDEGPDLGGQVPGVRIDRMDGQGRGLKGRQHHGQAARAQVLRRGEGRFAGDAPALW